MHSPLVLSALPMGNSEIVALKRHSDNAIRATVVPRVSGWQAQDVLEEIFQLPDTRSPELTDLLNRALALIAKADPQDDKRLREIAKQLEPFAESLPAEDLARDVIATITQIAAENRRR